jgi:hypothetical protein
MSIKTILVPAGGSASDHSVFETALAAGAPFAAHLDFYHVIVDACEAAENTPHVGFAMGAGLLNTLTELRIEEQERLFSCTRSGGNILPPTRRRDAREATGRQCRIGQLVRRIWR